MKRIIVISTIAIAISFGGTVWIHSSSAPGSARLADQHTYLEGTDEFLDSLGTPSEENVYDALRDEKTLAEIAAEHDGDPEAVVALQVRQLSEQLLGRLIDGAITPEQFAAQCEELPGIIRTSVYGA